MYKILVIDDDRRTLQRFLSLLSAEDEFEVIAAVEDGETAIQVVDEGRPDIIMIDIVLPKKGGVEIVEHIRSLSGYDPIIFVISDMAGPDVKQRLDTLNVNFLSYKSVSDKSILHTLYWLINDSRLKPSYMTDNDYLTVQILDILFKMGIQSYYIYTRLMAACIVEFMKDLDTFDFEDMYEKVSAKYNMKKRAVKRSLRTCVKLAVKDKSGICNDILGGHYRASTEDFITKIAAYLNNMN